MLKEEVGSRTDQWNNGVGEGKVNEENYS
jgi:hypothetical protein